MTKTKTMIATASARRGIGTVLVLALAGLFPRDASAHFVLDEPESWRSQDGLGNPQKLGPCGDEEGGTNTGEVTAYESGGTITVTINETIFHPGHYRIALSVNDRSELPPEPPVTAGTTPCGSVPIMDPPVFPVLADGVFVHTAPFSGPQTFEIPVPEGVTCDHCTLQVIEFMSNHGLNDPGGCFYHHCADISIHDVAVDTDAATSDDDAGVVAPVDASTSPGVDAGPTTAPTQACACTAVGSRRSGAGAPFAMAMIALTMIGSRARSASVRGRGGRSRTRPACASTTAGRSR